MQRTRAGRPRSEARLLALALGVAWLLPALPVLAQPETAASEAGPDTARTLEQLDKLEFDLGRTLESLRLDLASAERRFAAAQERLDAEPDPGEALREQVAARRLQLSTIQRSISLVEQRIDRVQAKQRARARLAELARRRVAPEQLSEWQSEAEERGEKFVRDLAVKRSRAEELDQERVFTRERREQAPTAAEQRWLRVQEEALGALATLYDEDVASLEEAVALQGELQTALRRQARDLPLDARLRAWLHQLRAVWNYELTASEDEPVTPGKLVSALVIFLIGWGLALLASRVLGSRVFTRMRLDEGAAQAFQSLAFYVLLIAAFVTALRMVQIPLTAFAVLGGALAIGVGFGSQNVVNNFISGIILLVERPIKLGDLIELGGVYGNVESIGLRSTRVRTGDNVHIIVPNASFLESNVINWTHTDKQVRITIAVGIVYGSPTREAERLIQRALSETGGVLGDPAPLVLFRDFGNDALVFETRFWILMRTVVDRLKIESEVRFRIDDLFREAGIVIAFPQRDVHLDSAAPLDVRLVEAGAEDAREA